MTTNRHLLPGGIPQRRDYLALLESELFRDVRAAATSFREAHRTTLAPYHETWSDDPLRQWSRQWEYPFILDRLTSLVPADRPATIVDAGSGVTFFPSAITARLAQARVIGVDADPMVESVFLEVLRDIPGDSRLSFTLADMAKTPLDDASVDAAYSVSALEHLPHRREAIDELARIVRPDGLLVLTFDICVRGDRDVPSEQVPGLLAAIDRHFERLDGGVESPGGEAVTTDWATGLDPELSPWRIHPLRYAAGRALRGRSPRMPVLTFHCSTWKRRAA